jgi:hypothetical protein
MKAPLAVEAFWDPLAAVWVATSDDVPGLATEAGTLEQLTEKLHVIIPELLDANGIELAGQLRFELTGRREELIRLAS